MGEIRRDDTLKKFRKDLDFQRRQWILRAKR